MDDRAAEDQPTRLPHEGAGGWVDGSVGENDLRVKQNRL